MKCAYCKETTKNQKVTYNINRSGYDVILHDIPAVVCDSCGEIFYDEKSVELIQSMIVQLDAKTEQVRSITPRFSLA